MPQNARTLVRGLRSQIVEQLRDEILLGRFAAGEPLREVPLALRFGVSRGTIRETLQQLTQEGMLIAKPNCGVTVAPVAPDSLHQVVIPIRRTIETYALRLIFPDLNESDFKVWQQILDRLLVACEQRDFATIAEQDLAFHRSILARADQPDLLTIWFTIVARVRHHFHKMHLQYVDPLEIHAEHAAIVSAFRTGDVDVAVEALARNIA